MVSAGGAWIGLTDQTAEGIFEWEDEVPLTHADWYPGEPDDNGSSGADCAFIFDSDRAMQWGDGDCNAIRYVICERKL